MGKSFLGLLVLLALAAPKARAAASVSALEAKDTLVVAFKPGL
jgi:hypothetical protein